MNRKERYKFVTDYFRSHMPEAASELHYHNAYELLVAVMLSAQCTDHTGIFRSLSGCEKPGQGGNSGHLRQDKKHLLSQQQSHAPERDGGNADGTLQRRGSR